MTVDLHWMRAKAQRTAKRSHEEDPGLGPWQHSSRVGDKDWREVTLFQWLAFANALRQTTSAQTPAGAHIMRRAAAKGRAAMHHKVTIKPGRQFHFSSFPDLQKPQVDFSPCLRQHQQCGRMSCFFLVKVNSCTIMDMIHKSIHWFDELLQDVQDPGWEHDPGQRDEFQSNDDHVALAKLDSSHSWEFWCKHVRIHKIEGRRGVG